MTRLIAAGSRLYQPLTLVAERLDKALADLPDGETLTVVHGGARGVDRAASQWCSWQGSRGAPVVEEVHRADWSTHQIIAGPLRNDAMVALGADLVLAFPAPCVSERCRRRDAHDSHGTADCMRKARAAGIPVEEVRAP